MDLIVTVGYVIFDIHPVKIESADGKKYPSKLLHMITIRASTCRGPQARSVKPLELGNSKHLAPKQPLLVVAQAVRQTLLGPSNRATTAFRHAI